MRVRELRYIQVRRNTGGKLRWYWRRAGRVVRLPDDPVARMAEAARLNALADAAEAQRPTEPERGTLGWLAARYRASDDWRELAPGTTKYYRRYLRDIEALGPQLDFAAAFTRRAVVDFLETYAARHQRRQAAAVLKALFRLARYHGLPASDVATGLRLKTTKPRDRVWSEDEVARWLAAAAGEDAHMATAFQILRYTTQRPTDMLRMTWPQYSGAAIRLRQQKTGALLDVPVHPDLAAHLAAVAQHPACLTIVAYRGRPVPYLRFNERFRRICEAAGIDAQARDLRRTAMLRMAEAGATAVQIASVSGHSIEATTRILETYLPRNRDLAQAAITRLVDHQRRTPRT
jgi:Phage integrase family